MPNCFQLTPLGKSEPESLNLVDAKICKFLNIEVDEVKYAYGWYSTIGFALACGQSIDQIRETLFQQFKYAACKDEVDAYQRLIDIADFIKDNYSVRAWYSRK